MLTLLSSVARSSEISEHLPIILDIPRKLRNFIKIFRNLLRLEFFQINAFRSIIHDYSSVGLMLVSRDIGNIVIVSLMMYYDITERNKNQFDIECVGEDF